MQTFVTHKFSESVDLGTFKNEMVATIVTARNLDDKRLGKQRVEAKQIIRGSFPYHPATKMWEGHHDALALYGYLMCREWRKRGFADTLQPYFRELFHRKDTVNWPWWFASDDMVSTHRSKLIRKLPEHYKSLWPDDHLAHSYALPYIWPSLEHDMLVWTLSAAELRRRSEWAVPDSWLVSSDGKVIPSVSR